MKKIGIYGGTFDPIHLGHLITATSVMKIRNLAEIIFIPANISPFKQEVNSAPSIHRLEMTKLAVKNYNDFSVSDYEIKNSGVSYSIDTIKHFKKICENIELIIGYDNFLVFDKWHKWEELIDLVNIIVLRRLSERPIVSKTKSEKFIFVDTPTINISSTLIRKRNAEDLPIDSQVTPEVLKYIKENNLYTK